MSLLLAMPAAAGPADPIGTVVSSNAATSGGTALTAGRTLFSGDLISTAPGGSAQIAVTGGGTVTLTQGSTARILKEAGRLRLEVTQGSAWFCLSDKPLEGKLADAVVHSLDGQAAIGSLTMKGPNAGVIAAEKGRLVVETARNGQSVTLKPGQCVEVTIQTVPPATGAATPGGSLSGRSIAILGGVTIAVISLAAGLHLENKPDDTAKKNAISPFRFP